MWLYDKHSFLTFRTVIYSVVRFRVLAALMGAKVTAHAFMDTLERRLVVAVGTEEERLGGGGRH